MFRFVFDYINAKLQQLEPCKGAAKLQKCSAMWCESHVNSFQISAMKWIFTLPVTAEAGDQAALNINQATFTKVPEEMANLNLSGFLGSEEKRGWPFCRSIIIYKTALW